MATAWTESTNDTTVRAQIRCDDPTLRPRRARQVGGVVSSGGKTVDETRFQLTFMDAAVWDVARIASPLKLRQRQHQRPGIFEVLTR